MSNKDKRSKLIITSVLVILILLAVSTSQQLSTTVLSNVDSVVYAYSTNSQAQSLNNECKHGVCANNGPQTQADGTPIIAMPVITQSGGQGEQGPPGPDKELQVTSRISEQVTVPPGEEGRATAHCETGETATGGGVVQTSDSVENKINPQIADAGLPREDPTSWVVAFINPGPEPVFISAWAACAKLVDAS